MSGRKTVARGARAALPSVVRIGATVVGLIAVTVAVAGWSWAARSVSLVKSSSSRVAALSPSSKECKEDKAAGTITWATPFGIGSGPGIAPAIEALGFGYYKDLCLTVSLNTQTYASQELVEADKAQVSNTAGALNLFTYDSTGGNRLVGVETVGDVNGNAFILNSKYKTLKAAIKGAEMGDYGQISATTVALLAAAKIPISSVHFVDLTDEDPTLIATVSDLGSIPGFLGSQDVELKLAHVPFKEITAQSLGVKGTTNVMYMNKTFVRKYPVAAANYIRANLEALDYCAAHLSYCVDYIVKYAAAAGDGAVDTKGVESAEAKSQYNLLKTTSTKPQGSFTKALWTAEYDQLKKYGDEANRLSGINGTVSLPSITSMMNTSLVDGLYNSKGQLIWP